MVSVSLIGMSLTSPLLLWIVAALAVIVPVVLIVVWGRGPGGIPGRLVRLVGIVLCQLLAVGAIGLYANSEYGFYNSWGELVPADGSQGRVMTISRQGAGGQGIGAARLPVLVWLPKDYNRLYR